MAMRSSADGTLDAAASRQSTSTPPRRRRGWRSRLRRSPRPPLPLAYLSWFCFYRTPTSTGVVLAGRFAGHEVASIMQYVSRYRGVVVLFWAVVVLPLGGLW